MTQSTIDDVAQRAGVSTATVSRALRGLENVNPRTRERVMKAVRDLNYVVDPSASRLAAGRTMTVGIVVPLADQWFYSKVVTAAEYALMKNHYDVLRYSILTGEDRQSAFERVASRKRVDGLIIVSLPLTGTESVKLSSSGMPVVTIGTAVPEFSAVSIDNVAAGELATRHLVELGHKRIGVITGFERDPIGFPVPTDRYCGYEKTLKAHNITIYPEYEVPGNFTIAGGAAAMRHLLSLPHPPTAVFAFSDEMAIGALKSARDMEYRVPEDVSVIGFDDHDMAEYIGLTTIHHPVSTYGDEAARMILEAIADPDSYQSRHIQPETKLIRRATTAPSSLTGIRTS